MAEQINRTGDYRYFLRTEFAEIWDEVTVESFIQAERQAGFYSKFGPDHVATGGFSAGGLLGKVVFPEQELPEPCRLLASKSQEDEERTFEVRLSYTLPWGMYELEDDRDGGERSHIVTTDTRGLGAILLTMDERSV